MPLNIGDQAPTIRAEAHSGQVFDSAELRGRQTLVVYFYPKDETPGCTTQACGFRDAYEEFVRAGALVVGVSGDTLERHRRFVADRRLPFLLLSDADGALRRAFGVPKTWGIFPGRVTYVIDRQGIVRHVFNSQFHADRHIAEALRVVQDLARDGE